jgi:hypothetical protein
MMLPGVRGPGVAHPGLEVEVGLGFDQLLHDLDLALIRRPPQWRQAVLEAGLRTKGAGGGGGEGTEGGTRGDKR